MASHMTHSSDSWIWNKLWLTTGRSAVVCTAPWSSREQKCDSHHIWETTHHQICSYSSVYQGITLNLYERMNHKCFFWAHNTTKWFCANLYGEKVAQKSACAVIKMRERIGEVGLKTPKKEMDNLSFLWRHMLIFLREFLRLPPLIMKEHLRTMLAT